MKRKALIGAISSSVLLYLALRDIEWSTFIAALKGANFYLLIPPVAFTLLGHYLRAYRWKFIILPVKPIRTRSLFSATAIGFMANNILPARLGEVVRAHAIGEAEGISKTSSFATIVYERIIDVFSLLAILWITLLKVPEPVWLRRGGLWILAANLSLLGLLILLVREQERVRMVLGRISRFLHPRLAQRVGSFLEAFLDGLRVLAEKRFLCQIALVSGLVWFSALLAIYSCFFVLDMQLPFLSSLTLIVLLSLGSMIPSAPAYIGTTQLACVVGLSLFGVGKSKALAYSMLYHSTQFFPITILGLSLLWRHHLHLGAISRDVGK